MVSTNSSPACTRQPKKSEACARNSIWVSWARADLWYQMQENITSALMGCSSSLVCTSLPSVSNIMATENLPGQHAYCSALTGDPILTFFKNTALSIRENSASCQGDRPLLLVQLPDALNDSGVPVMCPMAHVEAGNIHSIHCKGFQHLLAACCGPNGGHNLRTPGTSETCSITSTQEQRTN